MRNISTLSQLEHQRACSEQSTVIEENVKHTMTDNKLIPDYGIPECQAINKREKN